MADWYQISVIGSGESSEAIAKIFTELGAASVTFHDGADQPIYEPSPASHPLWTKTRITALFEEPVELKAIRESVSSTLPAAELSGWNLEILADRVWEQAWMDHFKPMQFGTRLWVYPSHLRPPDPEAVNLMLDPGLAFGTGTHPSTALCLEWLAQQDLRNLKIIDYGCGSGILAIASVLLGAHKAIAVDIDEQALIATSTHAFNNGVSNQVSCRFPEQAAHESADIVIANILANVLEELAPILTEYVKPGGKLVLAGIFSEQVEQVLNAYPNFRFAPPVPSDNWVRLDGMCHSKIRIPVPDPTTLKHVYPVPSM